MLFYEGGDSGEESTWEQQEIQNTCPVSIPAAMMQQTHPSTSHVSAKAQRLSAFLKYEEALSKEKITHADEKMRIHKTYRKTLKEKIRDAKRARNAEISNIMRAHRDRKKALHKRFDRKTKSITMGRETSPGIFPSDQEYLSDESASTNSGVSTTQCNQNNGSHPVNGTTQITEISQSGGATQASSASRTNDACRMEMTLPYYSSNDEWTSHRRLFNFQESPDEPPKLEPMVEMNKWCAWIGYWSPTRKSSKRLHPEDSIAGNPVIMVMDTGGRLLRYMSQHKGRTDTDLKSPGPPVATSKLKEEEVRRIAFFRGTDAGGQLWDEEKFKEYVKDLFRAGGISYTWPPRRR